MRDRCRELLEATLAVGDLGAEQVLVMAVERLALQVLIGPVSLRNRGARQHIVNPPVKARLFPLCLAQGLFDGLQNEPDARLVGISIPVGGASPKILIVPSASEVTVRAGPQKELKHQCMSGPSRSRRRV